MTKPRSSFKGAWLNLTLPRREMVERVRTSAADADPDPILEVMARQKALWQFNVRRAHEDAEPAQWADMIRDAREALPDSRLVRELPALVLGVLDTLIFRQRKFGHVRLFEAAAGGHDPAAMDLLREALTECEEAARHIRGRRGRSVKRNIGPALRAVTAAVAEATGLPWSKSRELAADLLAMAGMDPPQSRSQVTALAPDPARGKVPDQT